MEYKGFEITVSLDQSQEWAIDEDCNLVSLIDSFDVGKSDIHTFHIYENDEMIDDGNSLDEVKLKIDDLVKVEEV